MRDALVLMNRYNNWMNGKLLDACSQLSDTERKQDRAAPFRSIHGLWNHVLLCDRAWLARFQGEPVLAKSLDEELYADWEELKIARAQTDNMLRQWVESLDEQSLNGDLHFKRLSSPDPVTLPRGQAALHIFNHQTHHRGQITALVEQAGGDCGVTDLGAMPVEQG